MPFHVTWVCFECRLSVRRPGIAKKSDVMCPNCGKRCFCLWTEARIPPRQARRAWAALRQLVYVQHHASIDWGHQSRLQEKHRLERRRVRLELQPVSEEQSRSLESIEKRLAELGNW